VARCGIATHDRQDVDERTAAVTGNHRRERVGHRNQSEIVRLELGASVVQRRLQRERRPADSGVVDHNLYVGGLFGGRGDRSGIGDVERDRRQPLVGG
jgi:hypothetical protein